MEERTLLATTCITIMSGRHIQRARSELEPLGQLIGCKTQHIEYLERRLSGYLAELFSVPDTRETDLKVARIEDDSLAGQHWPTQVVLPTFSLSGNTAFASYAERKPDDLQQLELTILIRKVTIHSVTST